MENTSNEDFLNATKLIFIFISCIKIILIPIYHSTDFEVHRNWLAIVHNLPINEWYTNDFSQWTLDYPPLFAWFEYILSQFAKFFDPEMLKIENLNYASNNTILFQRGSVIILDCIFAFSIYKIGRQFCNSYHKYLTFSILTLTNIGLLVVDHIHFQYNGFLLGILLFSISNICTVNKDRTNSERHILLGALLFAVLLNLKHIYLYIAPVYIIWLLKWSFQQNFFTRLIKLGSIVILVFIFSFGPFMLQLPQVLSRLFPFKRGLVHAYWAPNIWALYAGLDKIFVLLAKYLGFLKNVKTATMTSGLVQEESFTILPTPTPLITFMITFMSMIPMLLTLNKRKLVPKNFLKCIVISAYCSFMFGWHVHEKAILTVIFPLCILAVENQKYGRQFIITSIAGHTALLPLLYLPELAPIKIVLSITSLILSMYLLSKLYKPLKLLKYFEMFYINLLPLITIYESALHKIIFVNKMEFLPLMITSIYCAIGLVYSFLICYHDFICEENDFVDNLDKKNLVSGVTEEAVMHNKKVNIKSKRQNSKKIK